MGKFRLNKVFNAIIFYILRFQHLPIKIGQTTFSSLMSWNNYQGFRVYAKILIP